MNFEEFTTAFLKWSEEKIEAKKEDGFAVCPYARKARLENKLQFLDARSGDMREIFLQFQKDTYEVGIAWVDGRDLDLVHEVIEELHEEHPDLLYFISTPESGLFAQNFTDCVFIQLRDDIVEKRGQLHKTRYYDSWPEKYYKMITGNV